MATSMKKKHTVCFLSTYYRKYSQTQNKTIIMAISWFTLETASKIFFTAYTNIQVLHTKH